MMKLRTTTEFAMRVFSRESNVTGSFSAQKDPTAEPATRGWRGMLNEEGTALVEMALSSVLMLSVVFGIIQTSFAFYTYNFVSDAAREATRYAAVRGPDSCTISSGFPNCNLLPTSITSTTDATQNPLLSYVENLGYPGLKASNLSLTATWYVVSQNASGSSSWTTACTGATDVNGNACNAVGNAVNVVVTYAFPLNIPFVGKQSVTVSSTSQMMIAE